MVTALSRKRKQEAAPNAKLSKSKKIKKQAAYSSGSSDESDNYDKFIARDAPPVLKTKTSRSKPLMDLVSSTVVTKDPEKSELSDSSELESGARGDSGAEEYESEATDGSGNDNESNISSSAGSGSSSGNEGSGKRRKIKRNDPSAFATSLSTILSSKLPINKRTDPVLARSKDAQTASHELAESKLEAKAKRKLREEKKLATEKGRIRDVLLGDRNDTNSVLTNNNVLENLQGMSAAQIAEQERRLRKTAQRGVVKLFNAVRAAQIKAEETAKQMRDQHIVGENKRTEKIGEMGRDAFLEMVRAGAIKK